jgi:hypothetical protein
MITTSENSPDPTMYIMRAEWTTNLHDHYKLTVGQCPTYVRVDKLPSDSDETTDYIRFYFLTLCQNPVSS